MDNQIVARFATLQQKVHTRRSAVKTEEQIKTALLLSFIAALGYDAFDPYEVAVGWTKDGSPVVDYAVMDESEIRMLVVLSSTPTDLPARRGSNLVESFQANPAAFAAITNGSLWNFHIAKEGEPREIDLEPILTIDLGADRLPDQNALLQLSKDGFDAKAIIDGAAARRLHEKIATALEDELADPSDGLIATIRERTHIADEIDIHDVVRSAAAAIRAPVVAADGTTAQPRLGDERPMTEEEHTGFHIVRAIAAGHGILPERIVARPAKSYLAVLLDDNNRRGIARLHFTAQSARYLGVLVGQKETRIPISGPDGIFELAPKIAARIEELGRTSGANEAETATV